MTKNGEAPTSPSTVLAFLHPKGGVARSTSALYIAREWHRLGHFVILEDLDPDQHLTVACGLIDLPAGVRLGMEGDPADYHLLDTAPRGSGEELIDLLRELRPYVLIPVKAEPLSVQAVPMAIAWCRSAG